MSKLFVSVNQVDPHNKSRQSDLALESYGLLSVVGYGYVRQLLWVWLLPITGNYYFFGLLDINTKKLIGPSDIRYLSH